MHLDELKKEKLVQARAMDHKLFYKLINQNRGKINKFIDKFYVGDTAFIGENILDGWKTHFGNLAKESDPRNFNQEHFQL